MFYKNYLKRVEDFSAGFLIFIMISPVLLFFGILVKITSKGPLLYKQERLGINGTIFILYKLRSMFDSPERKEKQTFKNDPEVTFIGKLIRRFKIDELPQLWNIVKGDMSFIGPRPCLPSLAEKLDENGKYRLKVRPGLTGLAQVNGNINLTWPERWVYDRYYAENLSFLLDCKIFLKTIAVVIMGEHNFINRAKSKIKKEK